MGEIVRYYITRALQETGGKKTAAARLLGLSSYQTLTNWMKRARIEESSKTPSEAVARPSQ